MKKLPEITSKQLFSNNKTLIAVNRSKINEIVENINRELPHLPINGKLIYAKFKYNIHFPNDFYPVFSIKQQGNRLLITWCNNRRSSLPIEEFELAYIDLKFNNLIPTKIPNPSVKLSTNQEEILQKFYENIWAKPEQQDDELLSKFLDWYDKQQKKELIQKIQNINKDVHLKDRDEVIESLYNLENELANGETPEVDNPVPSLDNLIKRFNKENKQDYDCLPQDYLELFGEWVKLQNGRETDKVKPSLGL